MTEEDDALPEVIVRPEAEAEISEAFRWYEEKTEGLGSEFMRALDASLSAIQRNPTSYALVHRYMAATIPWPYPENGAVQALQEFIVPSMEEGREYHWAITLKANHDDLLIGNITLTPENDDHRGYWLAKEYHRRGLMKEAVSVVTDFAFYELGMPHLILLNAEPNKASHRLKEISGARIVAIDEDIAYVGGKFRRIRWLLTREAWEQHWGEKP